MVRGGRHTDAPEVNIRRALGFLTSVGGAADPAPGMVVWFPTVGAALGLAVGGVWWAAGRIWPPGVAAALAVSADLALTGLLHIDGLADSADGLLPHLSPQRRLEVLAEPGSGAYAIAVVAIVLVLRVVALSAMHARPLLVAAIWCASRTAMAVTMNTVPYARSGDGLADAMRGASWPGIAAFGLVAAVGLGVLGAGVRGGAAVAACVVAAAGVVALGRRQLGGFTGDVLGAAGVMGETVALVVAAAKW